MSEAWCFDSFHGTQYTEAGIQTVKVELSVQSDEFLYFFNSSVLKIRFYSVRWEPSRSPEDSDHVQYSVEYGERRWRLDRRDGALFHWINILHWGGPAAR